MEFGQTFDLHMSGVNFILWIQQIFKNQSEAMLFLSEIGDPKKAFLFYFPLAYFCHRTTGIKLMWAAIISEWLNGVFKWILFGHRPYWWVHTAGVYGDNVPRLAQHELTCETGPGSPSGHAMVTASAIYVLVRCFIQYKGDQFKRSIYRAVLWTMFVGMMMSISLSRCFIATHFPHQVVAGTITGVVIGEVIFHSKVVDLSVMAYCVFSLVIIGTGPATYWLVRRLGYDPMWSVELSKKWCLKPSWVHLNTTLFYAFSRDASVLLGTGLGMWQTRHVQRGDLSYIRAIFQIVASLLVIKATEYIEIPQESAPWFYGLAFVKYFLVFFVIVAFVERLGNLMTAGTKAREKNH